MFVFLLLFKVNFIVVIFFRLPHRIRLPLCVNARMQPYHPRFTAGELNNDRRVNRENCFFCVFLFLSVLVC